MSQEQSVPRYKKPDSHVGSEWGTLHWALLWLSARSMVLAGSHSSSLERHRLDARQLDGKLSTSQQQTNSILDTISQSVTFSDHCSLSGTCGIVFRAMFQLRSALCVLKHVQQDTSKISRALGSKEKNLLISLEKRPKGNILVLTCSRVEGPC